MDESNELTGRKASMRAASRPLTEEEELLLLEADEQFIGTYNHTVDAKGRIVVPSSFRDMLGDSFFIAPNEDFSAVALYTKLSWSKARRRMAKLDELSDAVDELLKQFLSLSYRDQECDGQGRVLLPTLIRDKLLGPDKELEISGAGDHVNIMTTAMAAEKFRLVKDNMPSIRKTINQLRLRELSAERGSD